MIYSGTQTKVCQIFTNVTFSSDAGATPDTQLVFAIKINGTTTVKSIVTANHGVDNTITLSDIVTLETDDYIDICVGNMTEAANVTIHSLTVLANG